MRPIYCAKCKIKEDDHFTFMCYLCSKIYCFNCAKFKTDGYVNICEICVDKLTSSDWYIPSIGDSIKTD